ncbi:MAG TPA: hypothetical protein VE175_12110, partial [Woeseiaceae bacterium]|nr:hypothetical protein [Woeseiaceae bacterium]
MSAEQGRLPPRPLVQLLLLALVFFLPLAVAFWLYFQEGALAPEGRINNGALLEPIVNLEQTLPGSRTAALSENHWLLVFVHEARCGASCRQALVRLRQSRLMLGPDMDRIRTVFLHGRAAPDTVFLEREHP